MGGFTVAEKFIIEIFRKKEPDELTVILSDPDGKLDIGSAAALAGANGCAMALRAAKIAAKALCENERLAYIQRNLETLRTYMVHLIDEDTKGRNILKRAIKEGDELKIDAALHPACAICDEIINQMCNVISLLDELSEIAPAASAVYLGSAVHMCMSALQSARFYVGMSSKSMDETFRFVTRRENEITLENYGAIAERILARVEETLK